jgi:hypothetical protein
MSLVYWYKLNGNAQDSGPFKHHGTAYNSPSTVNGLSNVCYSFDGLNDHVGIPDTEKLKYKGGNLSFSVWVWVDNDSGRIISKPFNGSGNYNYIISVYSTGSMSIQSNAITGTSGFNFQTATGIIPMQAWTHICIVFSSDKKIKLYVNSTLISEWTHTVVNWEPALGESNLRLAINTVYPYGEGWAGNTDYSLKGYTENLKIFDHALSEKEVRELYKNKIGHWSFDDYQDPTTNLYVDGSGAVYTADWEITNLDTYTYKVSAKVDNPTVGAHNYVGRCNTQTNTLANTIVSLGCEVVYNTKIGNLVPYMNGFGNLESIFENRVYKTQTHTSDWPYTLNIKCLDPTQIVAGDYIIVKNIQLEYRDHPTRYIVGSRGSLVKDHSGYGRDLSKSTIPLHPQWTSDSKIGSGAYSFDNRVLVSGYYKELCSSPFYIPRKCTMSFWVKSLTSNQSVNNIYPVGWRGLCTVGPAAKVDNRSGMIYYYNSTSHTSKDWGGQNFFDDNWHLYTITWDCDSDVMKLYKDGVNISPDKTVGTMYHVQTEREFSVGSAWSSSYGGVTGIIDDVRLYANVLSDNDILELYQTRANLDNKGSFSGVEIVETKLNVSANKNRIDYTVWTPGTTGSQTPFNQKGVSAENRRVLDYDPWGKLVPIWEVPSSDITSDGDGGWDCDFDSGVVDVSKTYRYSVWFRVPHRPLDGNLYFGWSGNVRNIINEDNNTNPYFIIPAMDNPTHYSTYMNNGNWTLVIAYVLPYTWPTSTDPAIYRDVYDSGLYNLDGKLTSTISTCFRWQDTATYGRHRTYVYYSIDPKTRCQWVYPRVDICDGNEPSFDELLSGFDSKNYDLIKANTNAVQKPLAVTSNTIYIQEMKETGPTDGLVGWWPLDSDTNDYSGNRNDGTNYGSVRVEGINGGARYFDGVNDLVTMGDVLDQPENDFTISAWVKSTSTATGNNNGILYKRGTGYSYSEGFRFNMPNGTFNIHIANGTEWAYYTTPVGGYNDGNWHHVAAVVTRSTGLKIIVDGTVYSNTATITGSIESSSPITIGALYLGGGGTYHPFLGSICDVRIYNRALSEAEISMIREISSGSTKMKLTQGSGVMTSGQFKEV